MCYTDSIIDIQSHLCHNRQAMNTKKQTQKSTNTLWTRDFKIITWGSVVSMLGSYLAGFAMSLLILDYTQSSLYYAIYIAVFTLPQIFMPIVSGAILDRFSRKKAIYMLDFLSAGIYVLMAVMLSNGWFNFIIMAVMCFLLGSIESVYMVAYESFYPLLITEGNFQKAYSVASILETVSTVMVPVSAFLYNLIGIVPIFWINAVSFLIAAVMETQIKNDEKYIEKQKRNEQGTEEIHYGRRFLSDIKEGFRYLWTEKGLLAIVIYFTFSALVMGASTVITLPYFRGAYPNGEYIYMLVWGMAIVGRAIGGIIQYRIKLPTRHKFKIALTVYIATCLLEGFYLYVGNIPLMMIMCFFNGILGVTSYTIRVSATQRYVPDERKGRFNGTFNMLNTTGSFFSELLAGALTLVLDVRLVLCLFMMMNAAAAVFVIGGNAKHVAKIYNTEELPESEEQEQGS